MVVAAKSVKSVLSQCFNMDGWMAGYFCGEYGTFFKLCLCGYLKINHDDFQTASQHTSLPFSTRPCHVSTVAQNGQNKHEYGSSNPYGALFV